MSGHARVDGKQVDVTLFSDLQEVGPRIVECLALKGFCTVDTGKEEQLIAKASQDVTRLKMDRWNLPAAQVLSGLLGEEGSPKIVEKHDGHEAIAALDGLMTTVSNSVAAHLPIIGTSCDSRTPAIIHESGMALENEACMEELEASEWLRTFRRHRVMILVFLGPAKGTLELVPFNQPADAPMEAFQLETSSKLMVVLRPELLARRHFCNGIKKAFVASCFMLSPRDVPSPTELPFPPYTEELQDWIRSRMEELKAQQLEDPEALQTVPTSWMRAMDAEFLQSQQVGVRSCSIRSPGPLGWDALDWIHPMAIGADFITTIPATRFVVDHHYYDDRMSDQWKHYKTYCRHCATIDGAELFDPKAFGASVLEAPNMTLGCRWGLEVGYEAVFKAGWRKNKMSRLKADTLYGMHTADAQFNQRTPEAAAFGGMGSQATECNRISFALNLMGQSLMFDTDGSSSFAALWHGFMMQTEEFSNSAKSAFSVVLGSIVNVSPGSFAGFCKRGIFTDRGRCFSFDQSGSGMVRSEGCGAILMDKLLKYIDGQPVAEGTVEGLLRTAQMTQAGRCATLGAPSSIAAQEVMHASLRAASMDPDSIDVVECHAHGAFLGDGVEASSVAKVVRKPDSEQVLALTSVKTLLGSPWAASGIFALIKAICCTKRAGIVGTNHLSQINPHIDIDSKPVIFPSEQLSIPYSYTGFSTVNSFGHTGTYVNAIIWADLTHTLYEEDTEKKESLTYWPGGGGTLDTEANPKDGYFIVGTFNQWTSPVRMHEEVSGEWTSIVVLGENRWEMFQIWIDEDPNRALHPGVEMASVDFPTLGPSADAEHMNWLIDGRPAMEELPVPVEAAALEGAVTDVGPITSPQQPSSASLLPQDLGFPPKVKRLSSKQTAPIGSHLVEIYNKDLGLPGDLYKVRLRVAGRYRTVDWQKLDNRSAAIETTDAAQEAPTSYFVVSSWNAWSFADELRYDKNTRTWSCEVTLQDSMNEFQIVRNKDWCQTLYPMYAHDGSFSVHGPDAGGHGINWQIGGAAGDVVRIHFTRAVDGSEDARDVSWSFPGASSE